MITYICGAQCLYRLIKIFFATFNGYFSGDGNGNEIAKPSNALPCSAGGDTEAKIERWLMKQCKAKGANEMK